MINIYKNILRVIIVNNNKKIIKWIKLFIDL
jgi:hypothetical protein